MIDFADDSFVENRERLLAQRFDVCIRCLVTKSVVVVAECLPHFEALKKCVECRLEKLSSGFVTFDCKEYIEPDILMILRDEGSVQVTGKSESATSRDDGLKQEFFSWSSFFRRPG